MPKSLLTLECLQPTQSGTRDFEVNAQIRQALDARWKRITQRLRERNAGDRGPVLRQNGVTYDVSERTTATTHGGIAAVHAVAQHVGLAQRIDGAVSVLREHRPYHESDHVLNIAYSAMTGGRTLDDIELRRTDEAYLDALGCKSLPAPTTAGDFCRRFDARQLDALQDAINETRIEVWQAQAPAFFQETAYIDMDGSILGTAGECKEGMALSYKGIWGYNPLLVSLANTQEPLFIVNRGGNCGSAQGAAAYADRAIEVCRRGGFEDIMLRGDTDFSQTRHLDRWDDSGVRFVFGYDARKNIVRQADALNAAEYKGLVRRAKKLFAGRTRQPRHKEALVRKKGYKNIRLRSEDVAEFEYQPTACKRSYRIVVLRKNLTIERGEQALFDEIRYFFFITNDRELTPAQIVKLANHRCNQENLIGQLKSGVRALHAPVNTLLANGAYMVMAALAWSLKAWMALSLPVRQGQVLVDHLKRRQWLRMEFRTFLNAVINVPAQVINTGRRTVVRFLAWRSELTTLFRVITQT